MADERPSKPSLHSDTPADAGTASRDGDDVPSAQNLGMELSTPITTAAAGVNAPAARKRLISRLWHGFDTPHGHSRTQAGAAAIALAVSVIQWCAIGKNSETTEAIQAQIKFMQQVDAAFVTAVPQGFVPGSESINFTLKNIGRSPAFNVEVWAAHGGNGGGGARFAEPTESTLAGGEVRTYDHPLPNITDGKKTWREMTDAKAAPLWISVWWRDAFGNEKDDSKCFLWVSSTAWSGCSSTYYEGRRRAAEARAKRDATR